MSDSTTNLDLISSSQSQKEVTANALFDASSPSTLGGRRSSTTSGLTWGFYGGVVNNMQVSNGTLTLTASTTNYIEIDTSTGVVSFNTTAFSGGSKARLYSAIVGSSTVTSYIDWRSSSMGGSGGLTNFSESVNVSTPNATIPAVKIAAINAATNVDAVFSTKGSGALLAQTPDNTTTGGDKRGSSAVDWQMTRGNSNQVASGTNATIGGGQENKATQQTSTIAGGERNTASGIRSTIGGGFNNTSSNSNTVVGGGISNVASGDSAFVGGGNSNNASSDYSSIGGGNTNATTANKSTICGGLSNTASGVSSSILGGENNIADGALSSIIGGKFGTTRGIIAMVAFSPRRIDNTGDFQKGEYVLIAKTTNATPTNLTSDTNSGSTVNQVVLPNNATYIFSAYLSARDTSTGDSSGWEIKGVIKRDANAASTTIVGTVTGDTVALAQDAGATTWLVTATADTTNGALSLTVTGVAATTIKWCCVVKTSEVTN